jgi:hypothetical protein
MIRMMMMEVVMSFCKMVEVMLAITTSSYVLQPFVAPIEVHLKIHSCGIGVDVFEVIIIAIEGIFETLLE